MIFGAVALSALLSMPSCAGIDRRVLYGLVATESSGDPFAIHDDSAGQSYFPANRAAAAAIIERLDRERHAYSAGLTQVENSNFARLHVTGVQLLDPRTSIAIGCALYRENVAALRLYNTGSPAPSSAGNRYVEAVFRSARVVVAQAGPVIPRPVRHKLVLVHLRPPKYAGFGFSVRDPRRSAFDL